MTVFAVGDLAPEFEAQATGNKTIRLSELRGRNVILYFYPKDNTPGCTQEGQDFRDLYPEFQALETDIFGISRDSAKSHEGFKCKYEFPFELISDQDEALCLLFDVIRMKNMYGKQVRGIERSTFLIGREGRLLQIWRKVTVKEHAAKVLSALKAADS